MYAVSRIIIAALLAAPFGSAAIAGPADDQYQVAVGHYTQKRWDKAAEAFDTFVKQYPNDERADVAVFFVGEARTQLGQFAASREAFVDFLRRKPSHPYARHALFRTGEAAYLTGQTEQARDDLQHFHKTYPTDPLCAYAIPYLGEIAISSGDAEEALKMYRAALQDYAEGPLADECRFGLGRAHEMKNNDAEAHRFYGFLSQNSRGSLADNALLQQGLLYRKRGQLREAEAALQKLDLHFSSSELRTDARYWLGVIQSANKQWEVAKSTLLRALRADPNHKLAAAIEFTAAEALHNLGQNDEAATHYAHVVQRWPDSEWVDDSLQAAIQIALGESDHEQVDRLAASFAASHAESPLRPFVLDSLGRSQLKRELFAQAVVTLEELVQVPGADKDTQTARRYLLGLAHLGAANYRDVVRVLDAAEHEEAPAELQASIHLARASAFVGLEDYAKAAESQKAYLQLQPDGEEAVKCRAQLALSLAHLGQLEDAVRANKELRQADPTNRHALSTTYFLAETAYQQKKYELADQLFGELAREDAGEFAAKSLFGWAWTQNKLGQTDKAAQTFGEVVANHPAAAEAPEAAMMQAKLLEASEQPQAALRAYRVTFEKYPQSEHAAPAMLASAQILETTGQKPRRQEAADLLGRLVKDYPRQANLDAVLYQLAWILIDLKRGDEADTVFRQLVRDHTESQYWSDATYRLAERAAVAKNNEEADRLVSQLLASGEAGDVRCHALYLKGQLAGGDGRWKQAIEPMRQLLDEFPDSPLAAPARYWMAEAYYRLDDFEKASAHFETLHRATRDRADGWLAMVPLRRAQILAQDKKWREAYELVRDIDQRFPGFRQQYEVDYLVGRYLASQARFSDAREAYERVIRSPAGNRTETAAMAQWMIGESYFHQKEYDKAIKAYHRVEILFSFPRWQAAGLLQAAKCHELKEQWNEAVKLYAQLLKDHPETSFADQASDRLRDAQRRSAQRPSRDNSNR